jgi:hypothetical protein
MEQLGAIIRVFESIVQETEGEPVLKQLRANRAGYRAMMERARPVDDASLRFSGVPVAVDLDLENPDAPLRIVGVMSDGSERTLAGRPKLELERIVGGPSSNPSW